MKFKNYPTERLTIDSISSRLTEPERSLRFLLMERIIQSSAPVNAFRLMQAEELNHLDVDTLISNLVAKNAIVQDLEDNINFVYPVSALPTNHRVSLKDGRALHAMCAVDALGVAFTFKQDTKISSQCSHCEKQSRLKSSMKNNTSKKQGGFINESSLYFFFNYLAKDSKQHDYSATGSRYARC